MNASRSGATSIPAGGVDYAHAAIEAHWQATWAHARAFATPPPTDERAPAYVFADCPSTSESLRVGHIRGYTIADACARFMRARGRAVLFSLGFDSFGLPAELEAQRRGISPHAWVTRCRERMSGQFAALGCSCDWERSFVSSEPEQYRWTQWLFLAMLERGLIYRRGAQWLMRITAYVQENDHGLEALTGWDTTALDAQRAVLGRVDGVELDASTFDGATFAVFTPHPDAIAQAAFVAVSPGHPDIDRWVAEPEVAAQLASVHEAGRQREEHEEGWQREERETGSRREERNAEETPVVQTGALATVPGVAGMLPIVISPLVDARFGPTAMLGIPTRDATDASIAQRLPAPAGTAWKAAKASATPRPTVRYRARDFAISRQRAWGAPIPLIHCSDCGTVPVPFDDLPVRLPDDLEISGEGNPLAGRPDFYETSCPRCAGKAKRETDTIHCRLDGMWMWMPICVPPEGRASAMFSHPEHARWLPAEQIVWGTDGGGYMFDQRLIGKVLRDLGQLPKLPGREPFKKALMHQLIRCERRNASQHLGNVVDPNELVASVGADTVRLAVLHAASPGRAFNWNDQPVRHCEIFLKKLYGYAEGRLREWSPHTPPPPEEVGERGQNGTSDAAPPTTDQRARIDASDKLRRRLANWCGVACEKVTESLERLETQRAAHNAMLLLTRIQDFEQRALERRGGELEQADREAIVAALLLLTQLLAPLTPHIAEELWSLAGNASLVSNTPWPRPWQRSAAEATAGSAAEPTGTASEIAVASLRVPAISYQCAREDPP